MKHRVSELEGAFLDAAVAKAEGFDVAFTENVDTDGATTRYCVNANDEMEAYAPSKEWMLGGPIIDRERIVFGERTVESGGGYMAVCGRTAMPGPSHLIAAMRAYVASKFGEEIDL